MTYRIQYRDAKGRQVKETVGKKSQGWTKRKVQAELAEKIANVAKRGYVRPKPNAGPIFGAPVACALGETVERDGFVFSDLLPVR